MRYLLLAVGMATFLFTSESCTPNRGCTETTADNYDLNAEEEDGTCIPARDKLIGNFRYTRIYTDVVGGGEFVDIGTFQATEANTASNAFNFFFDGSFLLQGSITQNLITLETHPSGMTDSYSGNGTWLELDSVDAVLNVTYNSALLPVPQPFAYYCTKLPE
jgi:hypothetical protein